MLPSLPFYTRYRVTTYHSTHSTVLPLTTQHTAPYYHLPLNTQHRVTTYHSTHSTVLPLTTQHTAPCYHLPFNTQHRVTTYHSTHSTVLPLTTQHSTHNIYPASTSRSEYNPPKREYPLTRQHGVMFRQLHLESLPPGHSHITAEVTAVSSWCLSVTAGPFPHPPGYSVGTVELFPRGKKVRT